MSPKFSNINLLILLIFSLVKITNSSDTKSFNVSYIPGEVNSISNFKLTLESTFQDIKKGFLVQIENSSFEFNILNNSDIKAYFNQSLVGECRIEITNKQIKFDFTFENISESQIGIFTFEISNMKTHSKCENIVFNLIYEEKIIHKTSFKFNPVIISNILIENKDKKCGKNTLYTFTLENVENIINNSIIKIQFPEYSNIISNKSYLISEEISISNIKGINQLNSISVIGINEIEIRNINEEFVNENSIIFSISGIKNPPSLRPVEGINVSIYHLNGDLYMEKNNLLVYCNEAMDLNFSGIFNDSIDNQETQFIINFNTSDFEMECCVLEIEFPIHVVLNNSLIKNVGIIEGINKNFKYSIEEQKLILENYFEENSKIGSNHSFVIENLKKPSEYKNSSFKVKIYDSKSREYIMYNMKAQYTLKVASKIIKDINISLTDTQINRLNEMKISFINEEIIPKDSYIEIILPVQLYARERFYNLCSEYNLKIIRCTVNDNEKILINNTFNNSVDVNTKIEFYIDNIINYHKTYVSDTIKFYVKNIDGDDILKRENNLSVVFTSGSILMAKINRSSSKNYEKSNYTINFNFEEPIEEKSEIKIIFPKEIAENIDNENLITIEYIEINETKTSNFNLKNQKNENGFNITIIDFNEEKIEYSSNISIKINNLINPRSLKETSTFKIYIFSEIENHLFNELKNNLTIKNTEHSYIQIIKIFSSSITTFEISTYYFNFITNCHIYNGDYIIISIPKAIKINLNNLFISAEGYQYLFKELKIEEIEEITNYTNIKIIINISNDNNTKNYIPNGSNITIGINGLINPNSIQLISNFNFSIFTYDDYLISNLNESQNLVVDIYKPHPYKNIEIYEIEGIMNYESNYYFNISSFSFFEIGDYIQIELPKEFTLNECNLIPIKNLKNNISCDIIKNDIMIIIKINNISESINNIKEEIIFQINNIKNTIENTEIKESNVIKITTFNINNKPKENSDDFNITIKYTCNFPCKKCKKNDENYCFECIDLSNPFILNGKCIKECPINYHYNIIDKKCTKCEIGCSECLDNNISKCIKCDFGFNLNEKNNKCENKCIIGFYFSSNLKCEKCIPGCRYCNNREFCNECFDGYDLNNLKNNCTINSNFVRGNLIYKPYFQIPKDYFIIPIFTFLCCLGLIFQKCYYNEMVLNGCLIGFLSIIFRIVMILLYIFSLQTGEIFCFYSISFLFVLSIIISFIFIIIYIVSITEENEFKYWLSSNKCIGVTYYFFLILGDYKVSRFFYGRMTHNRIFNAKFSNFNIIHKPYRRLILFDLLFVHFALIIACLYIIYGYKKYSFLFFLCIYQIGISVIIIFCSIVDYIAIPNFNDEFYNQKKIKPQIMPYIYNVENEENITNFHNYKRSNLNSSVMSNSNQKFLQNNSRSKTFNKKESEIISNFNNDNIISNNTKNIICNNNNNDIIYNDNTIVNNTKTHNRKIININQINIENIEDEDNKNEEIELKDIKLSEKNKQTQINNVIKTHIIKKTTTIERKKIINNIEEEISEYNNSQIENNENVNNSDYINNQNELYILDNENNNNNEEYSNYVNAENIKSSERTFYKSNKTKKVVYKKSKTIINESKK